MNKRNLGKVHCPTLGVLYEWAASGLELHVGRRAT